MADNSAVDTLKNLLGDNAEQKIQNVLSSLSGSGSEGNTLSQVENPPSPNVQNLDTLLKLKGIIDEMSTQNNDYRSNLLLSLKPFMRTTRQRSIDSAVKLLNLTKFTSLFKL